MKKLACIFVSLAIVVTACKKDKDDDPVPSTPFDCTTVTYSGTIAAIVSSRCATNGCHHSGSGNGDYTSYSGIKARFDNGSLKQRVIVEKSMPSGSALTDTQYKQFECWINAGAPDN